MSAQALEHKNKGNVFFQAQNYRDAAEEFSRAIDFDPLQHVFWSNRSACYAELGRFEDALADAEKCVEIKPDWAKGYSRKGLALFKLDRFNDARTAYEKGLTYDPSNEQLKEGVAECERAREDSNPMKKLFGDNMFAKLNANPKTFMKMKNPAYVQKMKMLQSNPNMLQMLGSDPDVMEALGVIMGIDLGGMGGGMGGGMEEEDMERSREEQKKRQEREQEEEKAREIKRQKQDEEDRRREQEEREAQMTTEEKEAVENRKKADVAKNEGNELYKSKQFDAAIERYTTAINTCPIVAAYYNNRAAGQFEKGDIDACIADCQQAVKVAEDNYPKDYDAIAKAYARMGNAYTKQNKLQEAIESYNKSLLEKTDIQVRKKLQEVERSKKEQDAKNYVDPSKALEHKEQGNKFFNDGKWAEAILQYTESIRRNPSDFKVYSNRSACYNKLMDWQRALDDIESCLKLEPTFVKAVIRKGKIQHMLKQYHKALETFDEAAKLDPDCDDLKDAIVQTRMAISRSNSSGEQDPERLKAAMEDPEIRAILSDGIMRKVLDDLQSGDQKAVTSHMSDPDIRAKIDKLVAAGIISIRR